MAFPNDGDTLTADLARFDDEWAKSSFSAEEPYSDIPDGSYDAVIEDAHVSETKSTARPVVIWKLRIRGPVAINRVVMKNRVITENTLGYLKEDLEKCGLRVSRLSELPSRLGELVACPVGLEKRTKDGRANFYFRWASNRASQSPPDDDLPF